MTDKKIYIIGMGPGNIDGMSGEAKKALQQCDIIVGYTVYVDLLHPYFPEKEFATTPMRKEIERCELCYAYAMEGKVVAMVCSGDAGVYGMAAPLYEMEERYPEVVLEVISGVTAANSGAAILGAPLNHDYCVVSLSDLLTPWDKIEARLRAAIQGDFVLVLYNPSSHKRKDYLQRACDILMDAGAKPTRACGYVENIGRDGCNHDVCTLQELRERKVNMFTTVFIGNEKTMIQKDKLITPRGYAV